MADEGRGGGVGVGQCESLIYPAGHFFIVNILLRRKVGESSTRSILERDSRKMEWVSPARSTQMFVHW